MSDPTSNPGVSPGVEDQFQALLDSLQSNVGRYVAFVLTPILLPVTGAVALWAQDKIGVDVQQYGGVAAVVGFEVTVVGGAAGALITWLRNRGNHERAAVETLTLLKAGEDVAAVSSGGVTVSPGEYVKGQNTIQQVSPDRDWSSGGPEESES